MGGVAYFTLIIYKLQLSPALLIVNKQSQRAGLITHLCTQETK